MSEIRQIKTCYLAGPYKSTKHSEKHKNMELALKGAVYLVSQGYSVFTPHWNFLFASDMDEREVMEMCIDFVKVCDAIAFLPGWEHSGGSIEEHKIASFARKEKIYLTNDQIRV